MRHDSLTRHHTQIKTANRKMTQPSDLLKIGFKHVCNNIQQSACYVSFDQVANDAFEKLEIVSRDLSGWKHLKQYQQRDLTVNYKRDQKKEVYKLKISFDIPAPTKNVFEFLKTVCLTLLNHARIFIG